MGLKALLIIQCAILIYFFTGCNHVRKISTQAPINPTQSIAQPIMDKSGTFFKSLFRENGVMFDSIDGNKENWNIQIIYTKIDRNKKNDSKLTTYTYNKNPGYFYPASTVKFPIALLALEKVNELNQKGIDKNTTMLTEAAYSGQTPVYNDPNTIDGKPSIAQYIKKIFLVSDNDAANRLYEFLGQEYVNGVLHKKGFKEAQILHRLGIALSEAENRHTNPVNFYDGKGKLLYNQPLQYNSGKYISREDQLGAGYFKDGKLINTPMDFSKKNRISLQSLHEMLIGLISPKNVKAIHRFNITDDDRSFVLKQMSQFPGESLYPSYDTSEYHDAYVKFLFYGSEKGTLPKHIRIFNKVGNAYGQLVDVAYIADLRNNIEFFLSAAITCNADGILNDDKYDYDTIGFPFLKNIGQAVYKYELKRIKKVLPDLSTFTFSYDK